MTFFHFKYILLIMLLQLSQFFPLCPNPPSTLHSLTQSPYFCSFPLVMHVSSVATPFPILYFISPHGYSVTTYLYFLILSPLHPFPHTLPSSANHQNALCIHDSVSVPLFVSVCLVCFLDSIVESYVFAILSFIVLIFFFLNKSL